MKHSQPKARITGAHGSMIDVAEDMVRGCALKDPNVSRISLGIITKAKQSVRGKFRIKLTVLDGAILVQARGNLYIQEFRVFTEDTENTKALLAEFGLSQGYGVSQ
jgi:hypothetical protein